MKGSTSQQLRFWAECPLCLAWEGWKTRAQELHVTKTQIEEKLGVQRVAVLRGQTDFFCSYNSRSPELLCPQDFLVDSTLSSRFYMCGLQGLELSQPRTFFLLPVHYQKRFLKGLLGMAVSEEV